MDGEHYYYYKVQACKSFDCSADSRIEGGYCSVTSMTDVTMNPVYQELALDCLPTLAHETGTEFFPVSAIFDGDTDPTNNKEHYFDWRWVYIHVLTDSSQTYIEYWYYYVHNPWINVHEQDWELAIVVLDEFFNPQLVRMGYHGTMYDHSWSDIVKDGYSLHPICFAFRGSHAMWNEPGLADPFPSQSWVGTGEASTWREFRAGNFMFISGEITWLYNAEGQEISRVLRVDSRLDPGTTDLPREYEAMEYILDPIIAIQKVWKAPWLRSIWNNPLEAGY